MTNITENTTLAENIIQTLSRFKTATLQEIQPAGLFKRKDRKFIFQLTILPLLLQELSSEFKVLEINNKKQLHYETTYYDTHSFQMYLDHHNQKLNRKKVRVRKYLESGDLFLEIKKKDNKKITRKQRISIANEQNIFTENAADFIKNNTTQSIENLHISIRNTFQRITLINNNNTQRITIDTDLFFHFNDKTTSLPNLVIMELKQSLLFQSNSIVRTLKKLNILEKRISKYCLGQALLNRNVKKNRFKQHLLTIDKICSQTNI
jgi:hypothetical protein